MPDWNKGEVLALFFVQFGDWLESLVPAFNKGGFFFIWWLGCVFFCCIQQGKAKIHSCVRLCSQTRALPCVATSRQGYVAKYQRFSMGMTPTHCCLCLVCGSDTHPNPAHCCVRPPHRRGSEPTMHDCVAPTWQLLCRQNPHSMVCGPDWPEMHSQSPSVTWYLSNRVPMQSSRRASAFP